MVVLEFVLLCCTLLAVGIAVRSADTWNPEAVGLNKITRYGWIAITLGLIVFAVGVGKQVYQSQIDAERSRQLSAARDAFDTASIKFQVLREATIKSISEAKVSMKTQFPKTVPIEIFGTTMDIKIPADTMQSIQDSLGDLEKSFLSELDKISTSYEEHRNSMFD